jgi:putative membrane protein
MRLLRYIAYLLLFSLFLALMALSFKNRQPVRLELLLGQYWEAPLILLLFVFFAIGAALGVIARQARILKHRREIVSLRRELDSRRATVTPPVPPDPGS